MQALPDSAESLCIVEMGGKEGNEETKQGGGLAGLFLNIGLEVRTFGLQTSYIVEEVHMFWCTCHTLILVIVKLTNYGNYEIDCIFYFVRMEFCFVPCLIRLLEIYLTPERGQLFDVRPFVHSCCPTEC